MTSTYPVIVKSIKHLSAKEQAEKIAANRRYQSLTRIIFLSLHLNRLRGVRNISGLLTFNKISEQMIAVLMIKDMSPEIRSFQ